MTTSSVNPGSLQGGASLPKVPRILAVLREDASRLRTEVEIGHLEKSAPLSPYRAAQDESPTSVGTRKAPIWRRKPAF